MPAQFKSSHSLCSASGTSLFFFHQRLVVVEQCFEAHLISVFYPKQELASSSFCKQIVEERGA